MSNERVIKNEKDRSIHQGGFLHFFCHNFLSNQNFIFEIPFPKKIIKLAQTVSGFPLSREINKS